MARHSTPDEVEQQYLDTMGSDLGSLFHGLWNECVWLHWMWGEYEVLFGTKVERVDLLNATAPSLFRLVQDVLWESVLLQIGRLMDPRQSAGKENLTLLRLPPKVARTVRDTVEALLTEAKAKCELARDWRHRHIAHRDLRLALRQSTVPLAPASRKSVREAVASLAAVMNAVDLYYRKTTVEYSFVARTGDAEAILHVIRDGVEVNELRRGRLLSGRPLPEDLVPRPAV